METKTYSINRGVNKPIQFKGLTAQYIWWLGGLVLADMVLFAILYISGVSPWICFPLAFGLGTAGIASLYRISRRYGEHGLMKKRAAANVPKVLRSYTRKGFIRLQRGSRG